MPLQSFSIMLVTENVYISYVQKVFFMENNMKRHFNSQHGKKEYKCVTSGQIYFRKNKLKQHIKSMKSFQQILLMLPPPPMVTGSLSSHAIKVTLVSPGHRCHVDLPAKSKLLKTVKSDSNSIRSPLPIVES